MRQQREKSTRDRLVLIAEDHEGSREVYGGILRRCGYSVVEAADGRAAVEQARAHAPDLILMDIGLPEMDGWQAGRQLKDDPRTSAIPLIAFSSMVDSTQDLRSDGEAFDGFISKPVSPAELVHRVNAYLDLLCLEQRLAVVPTTG